MVSTKEVNLTLYSDNVLNFSTRFTKLHLGNYANETFGQNVAGLLEKKKKQKTKPTFLKKNLIKSAKITCSNIKSMCLCVMNISLVGIRSIKFHASLSLSVVFAAFGDKCYSLYVFF